MPLDPNDSRHPYLQVAAVLSSAIKDGTYPPGSRLPSRAELADEFDVAPMTIQNALRELRDEGMIVSRQGSGVFVRTDQPQGEPAGYVRLGRDVLVYACVECGAAVAEVSRSQHSDWHAGLELPDRL